MQTNQSHQLALINLNYLELTEFAILLTAEKHWFIFVACLRRLLELRENGCPLEGEGVSSTL